MIGPWLVLLAVALLSAVLTGGSGNDTNGKISTKYSCDHEIEACIKDKIKDFL